MMDERDPRVKKLQDLSWGLGTMMSKPGGKLPEAYKREVHRLTSKAISLCTDAPYLEEEDFVERAAEFTKKIEAKKIEAQEVEQREIAKLTGKCYRAAGNGGYVVGSVSSKGAITGGADAAEFSTTAGGARGGAKLTAGEVVSRCGEDPEVLFLCNMGLRDSDVEALCEGLKRGGEKLTSLDLSYNALADAGVQKLITALARGMCPKLQELCLGGNAFGPLGVEMLQGGLKALRKGLSVELEVRASDAPAPASEAPAMASEAPAPASEAPAPASEAPRPAPEAADSVCVEVLSGEPGEADRIRVTVPLVGSVASAQDIEMDVSAERLVVRTKAGLPMADVALPRAVDPDSAQAAFSRRRRVVTITVSEVEAPDR